MMFHGIFISAFCWIKYGILNITFNENRLTGPRVVTVKGGHGEAERYSSATTCHCCTKNIIIRKEV